MYKTLLVEKTTSHCLSITLNRPTQRNSINRELLTELHHALDCAENDPDCRIVILSGQNSVFCTGMDFQEIAAANSHTQEDATQWALPYMTLLKRFSLSTKIIIAKVEGEVSAGGVGLVSASDIVIAHTNSYFMLSEALWGLLPANVLPYLIRRIGFQKAYLMTLATQKITALEAKNYHLVDEVTDQVDETMRRYLLRLTRLDLRTVQDIKTYFRKLWIINEAMEQEAVQELVRLIQDPRIQTNVKNFVEKKSFPWEVMHA